MSKLIEHIDNCFEKAEKLDSKISSKILKMQGMSGKKTRHFYNNICNMENTRYLEIGTWIGSSLCSAMYDNNMKCLAIDNWSQFNGENIKKQFFKNFEFFKGNNDASFIEQDCWDVDVNNIGKFNVYMFDGGHTENDHFKALDYYIPCLDDEFIYIIDDWNLPGVRSGTFKAIEQNKLDNLYLKEVFTNYTKGRVCDWHNGIGVFVLKNII